MAADYKNVEVIKGRLEANFIKIQLVRHFFNFRNIVLKHACCETTLHVLNLKISGEKQKYFRT